VNHAWLFTLCRLVGCRIGRALVVVLLAWSSGFFFANSLFVWPKLLAATYVAIAFCIAIAPGKTTALRAALIGALSALGVLSHTAVGFTFPALLVASAIAARHSVWRNASIAIAALLLVTAPWTWYQHFYDPPADRLLKWHLAGQAQRTGSQFFHLYRGVP
jgi:hypothetical protein